MVCLGLATIASAQPFPRILHSMHQQQEIQPRSSATKISSNTSLNIDKKFTAEGKAHTCTTCGKGWLNRIEFSNRLYPKNVIQIVGPRNEIPVSIRIQSRIKDKRLGTVLQYIPREEFMKRPDASNELHIDRHEIAPRTIIQVIENE